MKQPTPQLLKNSDVVTATDQSLTLTTDHRQTTTARPPRGWVRRRRGGCCDGSHAHQRIAPGTHGPLWERPAPTTGFSQVHSDHSCSSAPVGLGRPRCDGAEDWGACERVHAMGWHQEEPAPLALAELRRTSYNERPNHLYEILVGCAVLNGPVLVPSGMLGWRVRCWYSLASPARGPCGGGLLGQLVHVSAAGTFRWLSWIGSSLLEWLVDGCCGRGRGGGVPGEDLSRAHICTGRTNNKKTKRESTEQKTGKQ